MYSLPPSMSQFYTAAPTQAVGEAGMVAPLAMPQLQQKMQRSDRLEVSGEPRSACAIYIAPGRGVGSGPSVSVCLSVRLSVGPVSLSLSLVCVCACRGVGARNITWLSLRATTGTGAA